MITLLPSEAEIVKSILYKLEIESIVPPARPNDSKEVIADKRDKLIAFHSLCKKLL